MITLFEPRFLQRITVGLALLCGGVIAAPGAESAPSLTSPIAADLFEDWIVAKAEEFQVTMNEVETMYLGFKISRSALGERVAESARPKIMRDIREKIIANKMFLAVANDEDRAKAEDIARRFMEDQIEQAGSEKTLERSLIASGMSMADFRGRVMEQSIIKAVIDREVRDKIEVTDEQALEYYRENPEVFTLPELARARHVLFVTQDGSGRVLSADQKEAKRRLAEEVLDKARSGADFGELIRKYSEDSGAREQEGVYAFPRTTNDSRPPLVPAAFEAAAFSLKPNEISQIVTTEFGYHIIQLLETTPARKKLYAEVKQQIKDLLLQKAVEEDLPEYMSRLRERFEVELVEPFPR